MRAVVNVLMDVHSYFDLWTDGIVMRRHHALYVQCREKAGERPVRQPPSSTVSVKAAEKSIGAVV